MASSADKRQQEFTAFDDVDLLETENVCTVDEAGCVSNLSDVQNDTLCIPHADNTEACSVQSTSNTNAMNAAVERDRLEDKECVEAESLSLSTEADRLTDSIAGDQNSNITVEQLSASSQHSASLSSEAVNFDSTTFPPGCVTDGSSLEMSTAVLTLDSDADSPQRQKTDRSPNHVDGTEVNVAALLRQISELTAERDKYRSLNSEAKEEIDNYQEQILEVWPDVYIF